MSLEDQYTVAAWADETFGRPKSNMTSATRANKEMCELLNALAENDQHPKAGEEIADIIICLYRLARDLGSNVLDAVDAKMAINRAREWKLDGNGHGYHVKEAEQLTPLEQLDSYEPDWSKPSRAVVASDGKGNGCVMHYVGAHLDQWRSDVGDSLKDLGLDEAPAGISIWEGKVHTTRGYDGDYDAELVGEFRAPTEEEWDFINHDDCPWDSEDYFLQVSK